MDTDCRDFVFLCVSVMVTIKQPISGAQFSECKKYRYLLWRTWEPTKPRCLFLMLNPSTADEIKNDPTVERCQRFAAAWGYGGLVVCNIFAYRATDPKEMKAALDPVGPLNDNVILEQARKAEIIVCAWGNHGAFKGRSVSIKNMLAIHNLYYLKLTGSGQPGHPLYLKKNLSPELWA